jgi:hypothetical protein
MGPARILLTAIVDYAGLFPPSKLTMEQVVSNYAEYRTSPHAWMLGRIVVPISRLEEFETHANGRLPSDQMAEPWSITVLVGEDLDAAIDTIFDFNVRHAEPQAGLAVIDAIELRADGPRAVDRDMQLIPEQITPYFEIPADGEVRGLLTALAGTGGRAKIRCGGVTPDAFPTSEAVAEFIALCAASDLSFKATAGLHHPVRSEQKLTYEQDSPRGIMHGFLNVFLAAAFIRRGRMPTDDAIGLLNETDPEAFRISDESISWHEYSLDAARIASVRESFAISFGSCSFEEPVDDLLALKTI